MQSAGPVGGDPGSDKPFDVRLKLHTGNRASMHYDYPWVHTSRGSMAFKVAGRHSPRQHRWVACTGRHATMHPALPFFKSMVGERRRAMVYWSLEDLCSAMVKACVLVPPKMKWESKGQNPLPQS
jgi:hypothetical protein